MVDRLSGKRKAALLLLALGKESTVHLFKNLGEEEIEQLTVEIAKISRVSPKEQEAIIEEFFHVSKAQSYISRGGVKYASEVLEQALGKDKAERIINGLTTNFQTVPFDFLQKAEASHVVRFIQGEQPQTIALILAYLEPNKAGMILSMLPDDIQPEVARRIAVMDQTPPEIVRQIEKILENKISSYIVQDFSQTGGVKSLVDVINRVDRSTEKKILDYLDNMDEALSDEVKRLMFVFEDMLKLDDRTIQRILQDVDMKDLPIALKTASEDLKESIFKNLSDRAVTTLKEEMEYMGPIRIKQVEEVQQKIVYIIRNLEEAGEITVARGDETEEFV
ncbi:MAG: flagellar motor switch protein FliG [Candidatus Margulisbacteria bacterium GWF2_35_9]|nr:MAG: flagellar motor switch protein FliG [Candidatus Margulisbacteria bacterium GWF2_35_9]